MRDASVYIVDDHPVVRAGVAEYVDHLSGLTVCGTADSAEAALDEIDDAAPDLVLIDLSLPQMTGIGLIQALRKSSVVRRLCVLSGHYGSGYVEQALAAGADGYILKGDPTELERGVRALLAGERFVSGRLTAAHYPARERSERERTGTSSTEPSGGKRVLIVDDNTDAANTLAMLLRAWGHSASAAFDGMSAVRIALEAVPDVVLIDISLPDIDGTEVAKRLRAHPSTCAATLIALSGYTLTGQQHRQFDKHFTKPVDMDELESFFETKRERATPSAPRHVRG
jgi:DNA-binding NarL/FixJ family response regulator